MSTEKKVCVYIYIYMYIVYSRVCLFMYETVCLFIATWVHEFMCINVEGLVGNSPTYARQAPPQQRRLGRAVREVAAAWQVQTHDAGMGRQEGRVDLRKKTGTSSHGLPLRNLIQVARMGIYAKCKRLLITTKVLPGYCKGLGGTATSG